MFEGPPIWVTDVKEIYEEYNVTYISLNNKKLEPQKVSKKIGDQKTKIVQTYETPYNENVYKDLPAIARHELEVPDQEDSDDEIEKEMMNDENNDTSDVLLYNAKWECIATIDLNSKYIKSQNEEKSTSRTSTTSPPERESTENNTISEYNEKWNIGVDCQLLGIPIKLLVTDTYTRIINTKTLLEKVNQSQIECYTKEKLISIEESKYKGPIDTELNTLMNLVLEGVDENGKIRKLRTRFTHKKKKSEKNPDVELTKRLLFD